MTDRARVRDIKLRDGERLATVFPQGANHHVMAKEDVPADSVWCKENPICGYSPKGKGTMLIHTAPLPTAYMCAACATLRPKEGA